jgi:putative ABC transport system permease protein
MSSITEDIRYSLRLLGRQPRFTAAAVLLLAMGIGANSAIFSVVDTVLLKPLPYQDPDRLYNVWTRNQAKNRPQSWFSPPEFRDYAERVRSYSHFTAHMPYQVTLTGSGEPSRVRALLISPGYFEMLGVAPSMGRGFVQEEFVSGRDQVAVLTESYWKDRFGADPGVIGKTIRLDEKLHVVAGILPELKGESRLVDVYLPLAFDADTGSIRKSRFLTVMARLKDGVSEQQASEELRAAAAGIASDHPESNAGWDAYLSPAVKEAQGEARQPLVVLSFAVGLVLLVTCANLANLLLVRSAGRQKEIAIRSSMGASQWRVFRQMITESVTLALCGGAAGLLVAWGVIRAIAKWGPDQLPRVQQATVDLNVLAFTFAVSLLAGVLFGMVPAWQVLRLNLAVSLREESRGSSGSSRKSLARSLLVVTEVACSVILLVGAGLLLRTFVALSNIDTGFRADHVLTLRTTLPSGKYADDPSRALYVQRVLERLSATPGVVAAGCTTALPMMQVNWMSEFTIEGKVEDNGQKESASYNAVSPGYFDALGARLKRGRVFAQTDTADAPPVVLISEALEKKHFSGEDPIGRYLNMHIGKFSSRAQVVGVVHDIAQLRPDEAPRVLIYQPHAQRPWPFLAFAVRTSGEPAAMAGVVRRAFFEVDPDLPVERVMSMLQLEERVLAQQRLALVLLMIFGGLAVVLATVGLYGVLAVAVAQRGREIGIRMAMGATSGDILKLVMTQGMGLTLAGLLGGMVAAPLASTAMKQMLFGVKPLDPVTFAGVALVVLLASAAACVFPARRAASVDPGTALRAD